MVPDSNHAGADGLAGVFQPSRGG